MFALRVTIKKFPTYKPIIFPCSDISGIERGSGTRWSTDIPKTLIWHISLHLDFWLARLYVHDIVVPDISHSPFSWGEGGSRELALRRGRNKDCKVSGSKKCTAGSEEEVKGGSTALSRR